MADIATGETGAVPPSAFHFDYESDIDEHTSLNQQEDGFRDDFKSLVHNIARSLTDKNIEALRYFYKTELGAGNSQMSGLAVMDKLEENGVYSLSDISALEKVLIKMERHDLVTSLVEPFRVKHKAAIELHQHHQQQQGILHKSSSVADTHSCHSLPSPRPATYRRNTHPSLGLHSNTSGPVTMPIPLRQSSLVSVPEDQPVDAKSKTSLVVSGNYKGLYASDQHSKPQTQFETEPVSESSQSHSSIHPSHYVIPVGSQSTNPSHVGSIQSGGGYGKSCESTQFPLEHPSSEAVRSKVGFDTQQQKSNMAASMREVEEQRRCTSPLALKMTQPVQAVGSVDGSFYLVPTQTTSQFNPTVEPNVNEPSIQEQPKGASLEAAAGMEKGHENNMSQQMQPPSLGHETDLSKPMQPLSRQWRTPQKLLAKVKRKKMYETICEPRSESCCVKKRHFISVCDSSSSFFEIAMEIHPRGLGTDIHDHYVSVKGHAIFPEKDPKCQELYKHFWCGLKLTIVTFDSSQTELGRCSGEFDLSASLTFILNKVVPHEKVFYSDSDQIEFVAGAELSCREKLEMTMSPEEDDYIMDRYCMVNYAAK